MQRIFRLLSEYLVLILLIILIFGLPKSARAQGPIVVGPNSVIAWENDLVPDVATARLMVVTVTVDALPPTTLSPVSCGPGPTGSPATTFTCSSPLSQIPTGSHTIVLTNTLAGVTSLPSTPLTYVDMIIPVPKNVKIKGH